MATIRTFYETFPEQGMQQLYRAPGNETLERYVACVDAAYKQAGLEPQDITDGMCPGIYDDNQDQFRISIRAPFPGRNAFRIRFLASNAIETHVAQGNLSLIEGRFRESRFQVVRPGDARAQPFEFTKKMWPTLIDFVMHHAKEGNFKPVPIRSITTLLDDLGVEPLAHRIGRS